MEPRLGKIIDLKTLVKAGYSPRYYTFQKCDRKLKLIFYLTWRNVIRLQMNRTWKSKGKQKKSILIQNSNFNLVPARDKPRILTFLRVILAGFLQFKLADKLTNLDYQSFAKLQIIWIWQSVSLFQCANKDHIPYSEHVLKGIVLTLNC